MISCFSGFLATLAACANALLCCIWLRERDKLSATCRQDLDHAKVASLRPSFIRPDPTTGCFTCRCVQ